VIGTGFFKPCVSVMVGQLYGPDDPRRDSGFTIYYMGINLGAFLAPLVAGTLGETVGWHYGFGAAAVGMVAGLFFYQWLRPKYLPGVGLAPKEQASWNALNRSDSEHAADSETRTEPLTSIEWQRIGVILILAFVGNIFFWTAFEQAGSSMTVFAKVNTDRSLMGFFEGEGFPSTWYQSVNPLTILLFAPLFAWLWMFLDRRRRNPSTPAKFFLGLFLLGLGFIAMIFGSLQARDGSLAGPHWLLITYVVYTWGELCLSPVGLSMVTKLAPIHLQSLMMGIWFFSFSLANLLAGFVAGFSKRLENGEITFFIEGLPGFYLMLVVVPIGIGVLLLLIAPALKRMMHGVQ
jgi:POT family proton-dependent oligopeptide transporter